LKNKSIYIVQHNLAGVCGPVKLTWVDDLESYWSKDGNFSYDPCNTPFPVAVFSKKSDADLFVSGIEWYMENTRDSINDNLEWIRG
jgi:hypothetical protein